MERCWRANANARPPTPPPAIATVAFVVGDGGAPATTPRPAHVSQRLRGGGPPFRRRLRDLVNKLPTLPQDSQARQASTAAALIVRRWCCKCRTAGRMPLRTNGATRRIKSSITSSIVLSHRWCAVLELSRSQETRDELSNTPAIPYRAISRCRRARAGALAACKLQQRHLAGVRDISARITRIARARQFCTAIASTCTAA